MATKKRLIDADALMEEFRRHMVEHFDRERCVSEDSCKLCERECLWHRKVSEAPAEDAVEVVHGRWMEFNSFMTCSECDTDWYYGDNDCDRFDYCPNCGAKMDGDGNG